MCLWQMRTARTTTKIQSNATTSRWVWTLLVLLWSCCQAPHPHQKYGEICDEMCAKSPADGCPGFSLNNNAPVLTISGVNIEVDGTAYAAPAQLVQALQDGEDLCAECRERCVCSSLLLWFSPGNGGASVPTQQRRS